jgi:hypothetical protein
MPAPSYQPANPESVVAPGAPPPRSGRGAADESGPDVPGILTRSITLW